MAVLKGLSRPDAMPTPDRSRLRRGRQFWDRVRVGRKVDAATLEVSYPTPCGSLFSAHISERKGCPPAGFFQETRLCDRAKMCRLFVCLVVAALRVPTLCVAQSRGQNNTPDSAKRGRVRRNTGPVPARIPRGPSIIAKPSCAEPAV